MHFRFKEEDGDPTSVGQMLVERMSMFVQSADLEVQERVSDRCQSCEPCQTHFNPLTPRVKPWVIQSFLTFDSMDSTLNCEHSLESC